MKERPILFKGAMVRAILAGTKTETRRLIKPQPVMTSGGLGPMWRIDYLDTGHYFFSDIIAPDVVKRLCPQGTAGDRLWVKETFSQPGGSMHYRADDADHAAVFHWKPSIFMRRTESRLSLEVLGVRAERLQDISEADAAAEGVEEMTVGAARAFVWRDYNLKGDAYFACTSARESYMTLWDSINGAASWSANPWVWVIEFRRVTS